MNRLLGLSLLLLAILGTTLSTSTFAQARAVSAKPFEAPPGESIKTIGLLKIDEPWGYFLGEGGVSSFGIAGILVSTFKRPKHPEYEQAGFRFPDIAERVLTEHLKAAGFNVISVPVERKKSYQPLHDYKALSVPNVDAYLDVFSGGVGYRQSDSAPDFAQKVGPYVVISAQLVSARSKKILYADTIEYAWRKAHRTGFPGSDIDAPANQVYEDAEAVEMDLMSADRGRSLVQLTQGIDLAMRRIVSGFSSYPAMELPQQAGSRPRTASPIDVAKAAPASVPSPSAPQKGAASTAYKIAIFPFESDADACIGVYSRPSQEKFAAQLAALIKGNDSLVLAYSYYDKGLNSPPIQKPGRLWKGSKPNVAEVSSLGAARGVDAVVMYWRVAAGLGYCTNRMPPFPVDVYAIDVKQRKTYAQKGNEENLNALTEQTLSRFLAGVQSKVVAKAPPQHAVVKSSRTGSAGGGFEGITLPAGGSVKAINAAAEAYCGSLNKKSKLVAAPPNSPNYVFQCYQSTKVASTPTSPTAVAKATPEIQQGRTSYKIGIFPGAGEFAHGRGPGTPWEEKYAAEVFANHVRAGVSSLSVAYSYYDPSLNEPPIYDYTKVWAGSKPRLSAIYREAETRKLDAVFMYHGIGIYTGYNVPSDPMPIELYLIDIKQRRTYAAKGDTDRLEKMEDELISRLLQGQPR
jgi:hypothetical protein